ncbi:unnamed protein product [Adineta steineri]|uniref:Uncharacterized protein n=1 Tax=Adineta steineri TaxID=433720 RepID=A0A816A9P3_9BILA|nr:unnamed protein product [Adineta steineri]CAF1595229.1 unnamed protein product [Adineta steineri]
MGCGIFGINCGEPTMKPSTSTPTQKISPTTSMNVIQSTTEIDSAGGTGPSYTAQSSTPTSTTTFSTISYYSQSLTRYFSTSSSPSSTIASGIFGASQTTTAQPTTFNSSNISSCNISMFDNGSNRTSVIYLNGTLYFNTTKGNEIDPNKIMDALKSFNPPIVLVDICANKSSSESNFNPALSKIEPLSEVVGDTSFLANDNTIPTSLLNEANNVTLPTLIWTVSSF